MQKHDRRKQREIVWQEKDKRKSALPVRLTGTGRKESDEFCGQGKGKRWKVSRTIYYALVGLALKVN